jgi:hypothetical protein
MAEHYPDLKDRPVGETICLFDVDGTLSPARRPATREMLDTLARLRHKVAIGYVRLSPPNASVTSTDFHGPGWRFGFF